MAASPAAKANDGAKALRAVYEHGVKPRVEKVLKGKRKSMPKVIEKAQKATSAGGSVGKTKVNLSPRGLDVKRGDFSARVQGPQNIAANYKINKNLRLEARKRGGETYAGLAGKWDF
jgi:2-oxoglutarate dehydrogenase complex dehydrogenase (E1) component-like enzyme